MGKIEDWSWQDWIELESTNQTAVELSNRPPAERYVVTAQRQTKGRGRRGRSWISHEGNLFASLALPLTNADVGQLVFVVSLALLRCLKKISPATKIELKWPNDVLIDGKKICGILLEKGAQDYIIIGIGVNILSSPSKGDKMVYQTSCLKDEQVEISRTELLIQYLTAFNELLQEWKLQGFSPICQEWLKNAKGLNQQITVNCERESRQGVFRGVDENGFMLLEEDGKINRVFAGDVFFSADKE